MSRLAVMQPYFLPYIGYFQLIGAVDLFIVYDNIKYTKKGWINRNRILHDCTDALISLPLKAGPDSLQIRERELATDFDPRKLLRQIVGAYRTAPCVDETLPLVESILDHEDRNLFRFLHHSIVETCHHLGLHTPIEISSGFSIDHELKGQEKVLALCRAAGASTYVNAIGGVDLYSSATFAAQGIELKFVSSKPFEYRQFGEPFVPWLSIIDVLMFTPRDAALAAVREMYSLVSGDREQPGATRQ
jgi:hypothetical protein